MSLLPAAVPDIPERRSEIVPARLARKVAPLFGVPWPAGPFGGRTWVSDYTKITLSEIARGAPLPTRAETAKHKQEITNEWRIVERIGFAGRSTPMPHEIANATLNRFGPDTKAAVILTAVNVLLAPVTEAVTTVLPLLVNAQGNPLPARLRLAAWAGLVLETFRSQPALVAAGIRARTIQRELVPSWRLPLSGTLEGLPLTRCEMGADVSEDSTGAGAQPRSLDLVDDTFKSLQLIADLYPPETCAAGDDVEQMVCELAAQLRHDETVGLLLRQLLSAGTSQDASHLWLSERAPHQLVVEALVPPTTPVAVFVNQASRSSSARHDAPELITPQVLPAVPTAERFAALTPLTRRVVLIALLTVLRHIQLSPVGREATKTAIIPLLTKLAELARDGLDADDPVSVLSLCRAADMKVQTLRHDLRNDLREPLRELLTQLDRCEELLRRGVLDRGAAAEAISSACVEINAVRWTNATRPESGLPSPEELYARLRQAWRTYHEALEIKPWASETPSRLQSAEHVGHHLHNYAAFLAGAPTVGPDVLRAIHLFRDVVIPARQRFFETTGSFQPLRRSLQVASRATTRLAEEARAQGDDEAAAEWAELGHSWVTRALREPETRRLLEAPQPTESAVRLALLTAPALLLAVEFGTANAGPRDIITVAQLIELTLRWERHSLQDPTLHARHDEVVAIQERLDTLLAVGQSQPQLPGPRGGVRAY